MSSCPLVLVAASALALVCFGADALAQRSSAGSCRAEIGARRAAELVRECRDVSLATRRACDAEKPCGSIREETRKSCELLGSDGPQLCRDYVARTEPDGDADDDDE